MAYVTGSAASFADLQTAVENAAVAAGWTLSSGVLSKLGCYFKFTNAATRLQLDGGTGQSGSNLTGANTYGVKMASITGSAIVFPVNYEIHTFTDPEEIYCVINYNSDFYQTIAFGKSNIPGIGGTGAWFTGSYESRITETTTSNNRVYMSAQTSSCGSSPYNGMCCPFWFFSGTAGSYHSSFVHCGLDVVGWRTGANQSLNTGMIGISYAAGILTALPTLAAQTTILVPVKGIAIRYDNGQTIIANPDNVRYCRIDNIVPGEIVTFGSEQWKVYPMYRKDSTTRDGVSWSTGADHSGTWGFAIKYTGT